MFRDRTVFEKVMSEMSPSLDFNVQKLLNHPKAQNTRLAWIYVHICSDTCLPIFSDMLVVAPDP